MTSMPPEDREFPPAPPLGVSLHGDGASTQRVPFLAERRRAAEVPPAAAQQPQAPSQAQPQRQPALPPQSAPIRPGTVAQPGVPHHAPVAQSPVAQAAASRAVPPAYAAPVPPAAAPVPPATAPAVPPVDLWQQAQLPAQPQSFDPMPPAPPAPKPQEEAPARPAAKAAPGTRLGVAQARESGDLDIDEALRGMVAMGASDMHLTAGAPPMVRLDGKLSPMADYDRLEPAGLQRSLYSMLTLAQRERFEEHLELDFSHAMPGESRFRVNMYRQRDAVGAVFRVIPYEIKPLESLGIPPVVERFAHLPRGLVLVTGPTGSGKSTTLASLIDLANRNRSAHIVTVEDPIEFLHKHKRSLVNQREVGADTHSFSSALKHVLRQDPDIILIGELRDLETIQVALTAAETGHLVFATLHTQDAAQTIDRVIDVFPAEQQGQIRTQLAAALQGVVCQALLRRADGPGRAVAVEVLMATSAVRNLIREGKTHQIYTAMQAGASQGMQAMDQHLAELVKSGAVAYELAREVCHSPEEFNRLCGRGGGM